MDHLHLPVSFAKHTNEQNFELNNEQVQDILISYQ